MTRDSAILQPKQFYRELDRLLRESDGVEITEEWFRWVVDETVRRFGNTLRIESGRLYEEGIDGQFELVHQVGSRDPETLGVVIEPNYRPLKLVLEHGVFLFDPFIEGQSVALENRLGGLDSGALLVKSEPRRILAFGLEPGWDREELDFTLHTIRNAINHRLVVQHLKTDFEQAAEIQKSLLPTEPLPLEGFSVAARSDAAEAVGGDFFDFLPGDPGSLVFALGDASGHGLPAALLARDVVTGLRMGSERHLKITEIVNRLNRVIARSALSTRFVSLFYAELESNGNLFYVNAGHPAPWIAGDRGVRRLSIGGTILGPVKTTSYQRGWAHVDRGDTLVVLTDGILERQNATGVMFDEAGVEAVVEATQGRPAPEVLETLFRTARDHGNRGFWEDDTTAIVITRHA